MCLWPRELVYQVRPFRVERVKGRDIKTAGEEGKIPMEPISAIALSLALGAAGIAGKEVVSAMVKDAYGAVKELIKKRYPRVSVDQLEQAPESKNRRAVVEE